MFEMLIHEAVARRAADQPSAVALSHRGQRVDYYTLNKAADACAAELASLVEHQRRTPMGTDYWSSWPQTESRLLFSDANLFANPQDAARFIRGQLDRGDLSMHMDGQIGPPLVLIPEEGDASLRFFWSTEIHSVASNGKLASMLDLPRATMILTGTEFRSMQLIQFVLWAKNGQSKHSDGPFETIPVFAKVGFSKFPLQTTAIRYVFPAEPQ